MLGAIDHAGLGLTIVRVTPGRLERLYSSPRFCELTGYRADELATISPLELLAPSEREPVTALLRAHQAGGDSPRTVETALLDRRGEIIPVEVSTASVRLPDGTATVSFVHDLRERVQVAAALRESEARFRTVAEASPDSITVVAGGRFVYANPATARVLGYDSVDEVLRLPLDRLLVDLDETRLMFERNRRVTDGERLPAREYAARRKDGSPVAMEISTSPITFDGIPATLAFGRDISERRAWHAELLRSDRLATLGILAASVAHEINNPLTYTLLHLDWLATTVPALIADPALRAEITDTIRAARDGGDRVRSIVRELLTVARHDHDAGPVSVEAALATALRLAGPTLAGRAEVVRRGEAAPSVVANVGRLSQVFLNLLLNAADAFADDSPANRVEVETHHDADTVTVAITDNGPGIAADVIGRIFEPLFTTKRHSTGLGLAICKTIVDELGGHISATSRPGETRLAVRLPIARVAAAPVAPATAPARRRLRVAVIDDDVVLAEALSALIAIHHDVDQFTAPRLALSALTAGPAYDHVVCDANMPGLGGVDLYLELCGVRPEYAGRFTIIAGGIVCERLEALVAAGTVGLLRKPFDTTALMAMIEQPRSP